MFRFAYSILLIGLSLGCASGHCRQKTSAPAAPSTVTTDTQGATSPAVAGEQKPTSIPAQNNPSAPGAYVVVYKEDGSLQCAMGKPVKLEEMEKELKGIPVTAREKKSDGMMRVQVCGASTGMMNTYKIPADRLAEAQKRGFKKWNF